MSNNINNLNNELNNLNIDFNKHHLSGQNNQNNQYYQNKQYYQNNQNNQNNQYYQNNQNIDISNKLNCELNNISKEYNNHLEIKDLKNNIMNSGNKNIINKRLNNINNFDDLNNNLNNNKLSPIYNTNNTQNYYQNNQNNQNNNKNSKTDYRNDMNEKMGNFRFDNNFIKNNLVPVNMEHIYSGNIFNENPIPFDMMNQNQNYNNEFNQCSPFHNSNNINNPNFMKQANQRILNNQKSKSLYKDEVNSRLSNFSPLGRTLYFPVNGKMNNNVSLNNNNNQIHINRLPQSSHNFNGKNGKYNIKDSMNEKMSNYKPLSSNIELPSKKEDLNLNNNSNNYSNNNSNNNSNVNNIQKVKYQDFLPVSSK